MAVSQKQIAEKVGVSIALVSRVLSGKAAEIGIAAETIDRVEKVSEEMGYVPSAAALSLKGKAARTVGVVVYDFKDPFFGATIELLQIQAHQHNYSLVLAGFINRTPREQDLQPLYKHAIDGLIVIGTDFDASWLKKFEHMPVTRIGHGSNQENSVRVSVDEEAAGCLLIDHLIATGRNHPVFICADLPAHQVRYRAFKSVVEFRGLSLAVETSTERNAFVAGSQVAQQIIQCGMNVDSFICATDQVAMGALNALNQEGLAVPDQIAVTGFDGIDAGQQFIPALTTIQQPLTCIAERAFEAVTSGEGIPAQQNIPGQLLLGVSA